MTLQATTCQPEAGQVAQTFAEIPLNLGPVAVMDSRSRRAPEKDVPGGRSRPGRASHQNSPP